MKSPLGHFPRNVVPCMIIAVVALLLVATGAQAEDPPNYCTNPVPLCNPDKPPGPGETGCYRPPPPPPTCEHCQSCTRSPCYVASGAYTTSASDLEIPTSGFPISVSRLYQTTHQIDGESGHGWVSSLSARLYYAERQSTAGGGGVLEADVRLTDGVLYRFVENSDGTFTPPKGRLDQLVRNADGTWDLWLQRTRSRLHFSTTGNLEEMVDDFGNKQVWTYVKDRLDRITDASGSGRFIQVDWGADGRISDITDPIGRNIHYTYENGVLTDARNPLGQSTRYTYEPGKYTPRLTRIDDHWFRNITQIQYIAADQDRVLSYTEKGETYTYTYGYNGVATTTAKTDSSGNTWIFPFGTDGLVGEDRPPGGGPSEKTEYDAHGRVTLYTDGAGSKFRNTYDARGRILTKTLAEGSPVAVEWRYSYDPNFPDKVLTVTPYKPGTAEIHRHWQARKVDYYPPGSMAPGARHHDYEVDDDGVTSRIVRTYAYDSQGRLTSETLANGAVRSFHYDAQGNLERLEDPPNNDAGDRPVTLYTYDDVGRRESRTDPSGLVTTYSWDALNRPLSIVEHVTSGTVQTYTTTMQHDEFESPGLLLSTRTDANGATLTVASDAYNNPVRRTEPGGSTVRLVWEKGRLQSRFDGNDNETKYSYDGRHRLQSITYPDGTTEAYTYRADGRIESFRDRAGTVTTHEYDALKRMTKASYPDGKAITWLFEGQKLLSVNDTRSSAAGILTRTWSPAFRLASETVGSNGTVSKTYDAEGRTLTEAIAGGATTTYDYYDDGSLKTIAWSPVTGLFTHQYDIAGRLTNIEFPNGQTRTWSHDERGRVTGVTNSHPTAGNLATFTYGYDVDAFTGTPTQIGLQTSMTADIPALSMSGQASKFGYDVRGRLVRADYPEAAPYQGLASSWAYDAAGNRISATTNGATSVYSYRKHGDNPLNGSELLSDGTNNYTYDDAGNTLTRNGTRGQYSFGWDVDHRLVAVGGAESASYSYDLIQRRASTTTAAGTTRHLYSGYNLVADTGASTAQYLYTAGLDNPLAMHRNEQTYYYGVDRLGSVVTVNDASGAIVNSYAYDAWGVPVARNEAIANPFGYTSRPFAAAGLTEHRFRSYEPATGSFRSVDPLILMAGLAEAVSPTVGPTPEIARYSYVDGQPTMATDPSGLRVYYEDCMETCRAIRKSEEGDCDDGGTLGVIGCGAGVLTCLFATPAVPVAVACWVGTAAVCGGSYWWYPRCYERAQDRYNLCTPTCKDCWCRHANCVDGPLRSRDYSKALDDLSGN